MTNKSPRAIAILATGDSGALRHLAARIRREHPTTQLLLIIRRHKAASLREWAHRMHRIVVTAVKRLVLNYDYDLRYALPARNKSDIDVDDLNSDLVVRRMATTRPDVVCVLWNERPDERILELTPRTLIVFQGFIPHYSGAGADLCVAQDRNYRYFGRSIYEIATQGQDNGVRTVQSLAPYFFESLEELGSRLDLRIIDELIDIIFCETPKIIKRVKLQDTRSPQQPPVRGLRRTTNSIGRSNSFDTPDDRLFKRTLPRSNLLERFVVHRAIDSRRGVLPGGWYILNYHDIVREDMNPPDDVPRIHTSGERFNEQLEWLAGRFQIVSVQEGLRLYLGGLEPRVKLASITFDDSLRSSMRAIEMLGDYGAFPTVFLNTGPMVSGEILHNHVALLKWQYRELAPNQPFEAWIRQRYFSIEEVRRLIAEERIEVGSHTRTHASLNTDDHGVVKQEVIGAHRELELLLGTKVSYFAFPYGTFHTRNYFAEYCAMEVAKFYFACEGGINQTPVPGALLRIGVHNETPEQLHSMLLRQYVR